MHDDPVHTRRLEVAIGAAVAEVAVQIIVLTARGALRVAPLRIVFLAAKLPFCYYALRRRPGAFLAVWLWEVAALIAVGSVRGALLWRSLTAVFACTVMVLLGRAVSAFPPVEWKTR
jgi:hypothetical protein